MSDQPRSVKILVTLGAWWQVPAIPQGRIKKERYSANIPITIDEDATDVYGYPSGHALRWCFIGLIACWLTWRHMKYRLLRALLMVVTVIVAFGGGFAQFYIGMHLLTDVIAGYLIGASLACCAIGLLLHNEKERAKTRYLRVD